MKLEGVMKGQVYYPARDIKNGVPYRITQERGRFLLEAVSVGIGIGMLSCPVGFFDDEWQGVFSWDANAEAHGWCSRTVQPLVGNSESEKGATP